MPNKNKTKAQIDAEAEITRARILRAYYSSLADHGIPPSTRELVAMCDLSSNSIVNHHVGVMIRARLLVRIKPPSGKSHTARGIVPARWLDMARGLARAALEGDGAPWVSME